MNPYQLLHYRRLLLCVALLLVNAVALSAKPSYRSKHPTSTNNNAASFTLADFGPKGDGVTDDGPAFQRAINAVAQAGGGTLFVPAGLYFIATPVIKDFSGIDNATLIIQGVPSDTLPSAPTEDGDHLSRSLDLHSEIIPATGSVVNAFTFSNLSQLTVEHLAFTGRETITTDAFITLKLVDIAKATVHHCEFYGVSSFGGLPNEGGGNVIRAVRSDLSIEQTVFLGCAANSGAYAGIVENQTWKGFSISNSIFIDYGQRSFFGKLGLGAPLSWINIGGAAPRTADSPRRQVVVRDTFLDEGGWVGITAYPQRWGWPIQPIDLIYISGLKMNVSNLGTAGHQFYNVGNVMIENSFYGWSHNTGAALDFNQNGNVILDQLTCVADANRIRADKLTGRLTVINSEFETLDSLAATTNVLETTPEQDPVQYVRQQFLSLLGREPDPASHFYWSDLLLQCGTDANCLNDQKSALTSYLSQHPQPDVSFAGTVNDEMGQPVNGIRISLTGAQSADAITDAAGKFKFVGLPSSGTYTVSGNDRHYTFTTGSQTFQRPASDVSVSFTARLNRHTLSGRITKADGTAAAGVTVQLDQSASSSVTTDANGSYSFVNLGAGGNYTIMPSSGNFVFYPGNTTVLDLSADGTANFAMRLKPELITTPNSDEALVLTAVAFLAQPFSVVDLLGFSNDGFKRSIIFAKNLEGLNDRTLYSFTATDENGKNYPLEIEFVGDVPRQSWLKQFNVKLSPELSGKCVQLTLTAGGVTTNTGRLCLAED